MRCLRLFLWSAVLIPGTMLLSSCTSWHDFWNGDETKEKETEKEKEAVKAKTPEELENERFAFLRKEEKRIPRKPDSSPESLDDEQVKFSSITDEKKVQDKIGKVPDSAVQPKLEAPKPPLHFYDDFTILNGNEEIQVNLVFNSAPLLDVLPSFADALGFNFLADSDLKGVVTLNIDQKMTRKDLWNTFDRMLNLAGAGVVVDGTLLRIMSLSKISRATDSRFSKDGSGELLYFPLKNTTAKDAVAQIRPFLGVGANCVELTRPNAVMIADDRANMPKVKQVLEYLDASGKSNWKRKVIFCRNILPSKLAEELVTILPVLGFNVYQKTERTEQPGSIQLAGVDRLQIIIVAAATQEAITEIEQWVELLDSSDSLDQERAFVYKVRHGKAADLARALAIIYDVQGSSLTIDTNTGNSRTDTISSTAASRTTTTANRTGTTSGNQNQVATRTTDTTSTDRTSNVFSNPVRVFADGVLNRLAVRTTPRTYASIKALLDRMDVVPAQVLLQVLVVEVTLTESTQFGLEFSALSKGNSDDSLIGTNYANITKPKDTSAGTVDGSGFSFLTEDPDNPNTRFAYIKALAGNNAIKVISSPQMLVTSHTEANITVGTKVPVITSAITNTSSSGDLNQTYQYIDTGIILTVTPQVTSTDLIAIKVKQELSDVKTNPNPDIANPYINQRVVDTSMTIANGRSMIIGGLIQEKFTDDLSSIPVINKIPIINRLTGSTVASMERSEILVMVTGYIVNERSKIEDLIRRYNEALQALNKFDEGLGDQAKKSQPNILGDKDFWTDGTVMAK